MRMSFDYQGVGVLVDRFCARILGEPDPNPDVREMMRDGVRVAVMERLVAEGRAPAEVPVIYAPGFGQGA